MATKKYDRYLRLEPRPFDRDPNRGIAAKLHDPVWFLSRQWQVGEHQGENASTPVLVTYHAKDMPIQALNGDPRLDPTVVPAEAIVESETDDWWTMGRRIRIGKQVAEAAGLAGREDLPAVARLHAPPPPYERFDSAFDGLGLWRLAHRQPELGITPQHFGANVPPGDGPDLWDSAELVYTATFQSDERPLLVQRHRGGHMDWYSAEGDDRVPLPEPSELPPGTVVHPAPLEYPGAPHSRWWQIEDADLDIGGYPPDPSHFATALLLDLVFSNSNEWFTFPVNTHIGHIITLFQVTVTDAFGKPYDVEPPEDWSLFQTTGLRRESLVVWPTASTPLEGDVLEDVILGTDEYSNLLWAVERRIDGRAIEFVPPPDLGMPGTPINAGVPKGDTAAPKSFIYVPGKNVAAYWHPYLIDEADGRRRFIQGRMADLSLMVPRLMPEARAKVLSDPVAEHDPNRPVHQIEPATVPSTGLALERRWMLARDTQGRPVLWIQRQRKPLLAPPARQVRFDVLEEALLQGG